MAAYGFRWPYGFAQIVVGGGFGVEGAYFAWLLASTTTTVVPQALIDAIPEDAPLSLGAGISDFPF
jgi:hypothetical protein